MQVKQTGILNAALLSIGTLLTLSPAGVATARAGTAEDEARVLFRQGNELFDSKDYAAALEKYRKAKALFPSYKIDVNIGTTLSALGRDAEAADHYERFLRQARRVAPRELVKEVESSLGDLRKKLVAIEVRCPVAGGVVEVDGRASGTTPLGFPIYTAPGRHRITVSKKGQKTVELSLSAAAGEVHHLEVPWTEGAAPAAARPASPPVASPPTSTAAPTATAARDLDASRRRSKTTLAIVGLAAGGAFVVAAAICYGVGGARYSDARSSYDALGPSDTEGAFVRYKNDMDSAVKLYIPGHVFAGLAAAALAFSIYELATRPASVERGVEGRVGGGPALALSSSGAVASWHGRF